MIIKGKRKSIFGIGVGIGIVILGLLSIYPNSLLSEGQTKNSNQELDWSGKKLPLAFTHPKEPFLFDLSKHRREYTPLENAVITNDFRVVEKLITSNPKSVNVENTDFGFPLIFAVQNNNILITSMLLHSGANVNAKIKNGMSSLYLAVTRNQLEIVDLLLKFKANPNDSLMGNPVIDMAQNSNYLEIVSLLLKAGAKTRPRLERPLPTPKSI